MTVREPEWSPDDVALLVASRVAERQPRGSHGHLLSEATDPASQFSWGVPKNALGVPLARTDYVAKTLSDAQKLRKKLFPNEDTSSLLWRVERNVED